MKAITVRPSPSDPHQAILTIGGLTMRAALGRSGIGTFKREGDGLTPRHPLKLLYGFWRADRVARPATRLPMHSLSPRMIWCDAPQHPAYNRLSRLPMAASHESMCRGDHLYDLCVVLDWNVTQRQRGAGSAIFMHLAREGYKPTEGCIALAERDLRRLLAVAHKGATIHVK